MNFNLSSLELRIILLDPTLSISELAEETGVTKGYISRIVASLTPIFVKCLCLIIEPYS